MMGVSSQLHLRITVESGGRQQQNGKYSAPMVLLSRVTIDTIAGCPTVTILSISRACPNILRAPPL
jgi:hypothetical protein